MEASAFKTAPYDKLCFHVSAGTNRAPGCQKTGLSICTVVQPTTCPLKRSDFCASLCEKQSTQTALKISQPYIRFVIITAQVS